MESWEVIGEKERCEGKRNLNEKLEKAKMNNEDKKERKNQDKIEGKR